MTRQRTLAIGLVLFAAVSVATTAGLAQPSPVTATERALQRLAADARGRQPAPAFRFIVMGDSRPADLGVLPADFKQALAEANVWRPAFVAALGDLIIGYAGPATLQREWDTQLRGVSACQAPFIAVVGDHDVFDANSTRIWQERIGPLSLSFDYADSHFVCINAVEQPTGLTSPAVLSESQLSWLTDDLEAHKRARNVFVFMHKPIFDRGIFPDTNWERAHDLLKHYAVRAVFAGGERAYRRYAPRDGIEYVISGCTGAPTGDYPELGEFSHYLVVEVEGANVHWAVVKPGAVASRDAVTDDGYRKLSAEVAKAEEAVAISWVVEPYLDAKAPDTMSVAIRNPADTPANVNVHWDSPGPAWRITPADAQARLAPGASQVFQFAPQLADPRWLAAALPRLSVEFIGDDGHRVPVRKSPKVAADPVQCPRAGAPVAIDGDLAEWPAARPFLFRKLHGSKAITPDDLCVATRMMWDDESFYLAAEVWDDVFTPAAKAADVESGDALMFSVGGLSGVMACIGGEGCLLQRDKAPARIPGGKVGVRRDGARTIYEVAVPLAAVFKQPPAAGAKMDANLSVTDRDGSGPLNWMWQSWQVELR